MTGQPQQPSNEQSDDKVSRQLNQGEPMALTTDQATSVTVVKPNGDYKQRPSQPAVAQPHRPPPIAAPSRDLQPSSAHLKRVASPTGGVQVTLDGKGSWSELARQDATLPTDANCVDGSKQETNGGVFGFLNRKKGRSNSPKPRERGVLGKEGARVIIG